ncbi:uncharacterized protein LOC114518658 [Rhizophagus irregularis DAOM 181602=DAOM 197198]|nr:uncharacterized protein LOC114518658 [Rhizophagus irregularis DAOM 181602=DAOM 197198]
MSDNTYENVNPETIRKRKAKAQEMPEQRQARLNRESERKRQKRNNKKEMERDDEHVICLAHESNRKRVLRAHNKNQLQDQQINESNDNEHIQRKPDNRNMHVRSTSSTKISENDHKVLQKFCNKMDNIQYNTCPECNERISNMTLIMGECRHYHNDKKTPKKFSADNNMDPGEVPDELQGLTDIEEMLIAQVFMVMSVYRLQAKALYWLKANNPYYEDIIIDDEILKSLPQNGSIINQIHQIRSDQIIDEMDDISNENKNENGHDESDAITHSFVPALPSTQRENAIINDTLDRIQSNEQPVLWPEIDGSPINEFQTLGYIARAFPTLYPYGKGDLRSNRP